MPPYRYNEESADDILYDPARDNRGIIGFVDPPGTTTADLFHTKRHELRRHNAKHGLRPRVYVRIPCFNVKSGGIKTLYKLVHDLNTHGDGIRAFVIYDKPQFSKLNWIDPAWNTPVISIDQLPLAIAPPNRSSDSESDNDMILINSEGGYIEWEDPIYQLIPGSTQAIKGVFVLNYCFLFNGVGKYGNLRNFSTDGHTDFLLVNNDYTGWVVNQKMGSNTVYLPRGVDEEHYFDPNNASIRDWSSPSNSTHSRHPIVVSYVTRKSPTGNLVRQALEQEFTDNVEWVPMWDFSEEEYAATLRRSHIYMTCGKLEGENMGVKEAWAAGALVVGFHGHGASVFMRGGHNSVVVLPNGDDDAFVQEMRTVLQNLLQNRQHYHPVIANAKQSLKEIGAPDMEQAEFIGDLLTAYRYGFPFENRHLWVSGDNPHIFPVVTVPSQDDTTDSVVWLRWTTMTSLLALALLYYLFSTRVNGCRKRAGPAPQLVQPRKDDKYIH